MSDTMLHSILQMPPELWSNDAIDIAQRHGRYLEASKRIERLEVSLYFSFKAREADLKVATEDRNKAKMEIHEAREELNRVRKELVASNRGAEKNAKVNQGLCAKLADAERERDEARRELAELRKNSLALVEELKKSVIRLVKERDEARRELDETISCIEQAIVHNQFNSAFVIRNLLENINQRRKHDTI